MKHLIAGILTLWAGAVDAQNSTPAFDALVLEGLAVSTAERKLLQDSFGNYSYDENLLINAGQFAMRNDTGNVITVEAELIGTYDDSSRTFTWGWATDALPTLERHAVNAVRAYGRSNNIPELTTPRSIGGAVDANVRSSIATVLGELELVTKAETAGLTLFIGLPALGEAS